MKSRFWAVVSIMVVIQFIVPTFSMAAAQEIKQPVTLTWTAGGVGGGWYVQAGGIARVIAEKHPNLIIKVIPGGGVGNPVLVSRHRADLGWGITFVDKMAFKGIAPIYKTPNPNVRSLGGVFGIYQVHFLAAKAQGIQTMGQLAEKVKAGQAIRVAVPMMGTSDLPLVQNILAFYGISLKAIQAAGGKVFHAVYSDMVNLYKDHHVDFVFTHLAIPAAVITEMTVSRQSTLLSLSDACIDHLHQTLGTLSRASGNCVIPAGTYQGQAKAVPTVATAGELLINKDVPVPVAYTIIKTICDNIDQLRKINPANKTFKPADGWKNVAVPLHPGAVKFYKEAGYMQ